MLYLYTILMLAWDLDYDTHQYFRQYLQIFIHHRRISKYIHSIAHGLRNIPLTQEMKDKEGTHMRTSLRPPWQRMTEKHLHGVVDRHGRRSKCSVLRLPSKVYRPPYCISSDYKEEIDKKHQTKYYIAGLLGEHDSVRIDSGTIAETIKFTVPHNKQLVEICKLYNYSVSNEICDVMVYVNEQYHVRSVPNKRAILRYLMKVEDH